MNLNTNIFAVKSVWSERRRSQAVMQGTCKHVLTGYLGLCRRCYPSSHRMMSSLAMTKASWVAAGCQLLCSQEAAFTVDWLSSIVLWSSMMTVLTNSSNGKPCEVKKITLVVSMTAPLCDDLGQGFPTFLWPCTPLAFRQMSMYP